MTREDIQALRVPLIVLAVLFAVSNISEILALRGAQVQQQASPIGGDKPHAAIRMALRHHGAVQVEHRRRQTR